MWFSSVYRMRLILLLTLVCMLSAAQTKVIKKSQKELVTIAEAETVSSTKPPHTAPKKSKYVATKIKTIIPPQPAIIAIEIVDPNDNSTRKKNGKRTIESSLGYGYQPPNYFGVSHTPKYQVYKYSQRDIPAFQGQHQHPQQQTYSGENTNYEIQKSIRYDLGSSKPELVHGKDVNTAYKRPGKTQGNLNQYYSPGTVLYSTLNSHGQVGGLSSHAPAHQQAGGMVPVIILRVFTNQLSSPGTLHPNLPQSHPYSSLNSLDLQSLLSGYVQQGHAGSGYQQPQQPGHNYQSTTQYQTQPQQQNYQHLEQVYQQQPQSYSKPQKTYEYYQQQQGYNYNPPQVDQYQNQGLQTSENYPDDVHTKVIFHKNSGASTKKPKQTVTSPGLAAYKTQPKEIRVTVPENAFSSIHVQEQEVPSYDYSGAKHETKGGYVYYPSQAEYERYYQQQQQQQYQQPEEQAQQQQQQYQQPEEQPAQHYQQDPQQYAQQDNQQYAQQDNQQYAQQDSQQQYTQQYSAQDIQQYASPDPQQQYSQDTQQFQQAVQQYVQNPGQQSGQQYHQEVQQYTASTDNDGYVQQKEEQPQQQHETTSAKVYNYHAHGQLGTPKIAKETKKKRRASRLPLVLSPKVREEQEASKDT